MERIASNKIICGLRGHDFMIERVQWLSWLRAAETSPTAAYMTGLLLMAALATAVWLSSFALIAAQERVAVELNVAGRQRMLSQRIGMIASNIARFEAVSGKQAAPIIAGCADLMLRAHETLLARDKELLPPPPEDLLPTRFAHND